MFSSDSLHIQQVLSQFNIIAKVELSPKTRHLVNDTRSLKEGDIFCAINGTKQLGRDYIPQALKNNCQLILVECDDIAEHGKHSKQINSLQQAVVIIEFYQLNKQLFELAKSFYQSPQQRLHIIGITGTNGKTSTSQMIAKLLAASGKTCSVIGTNGAGQVDQLQPIVNTTPGATELHQLLNGFVEKKQQYVAMEVSSHALEQGRVRAPLFATAVFTNLSRDHLDYHQTMTNYAQAKYQLFSQSTEQMAVINGDDSYAQQWLNSWADKQNLIVYGRGSEITKYEKHLQAVDIQHQQNGVQFLLNSHLGTVNFTSPLIGDFNIDNLLAAIAVLVNENVALEDIAQAVKTLTPVDGRMEGFSATDLPLAVVDYAHTPDALENALIACRQHCQGALWVVFGCGGDRDTGKRPLMGEIAERQSDHVIVTNDNPRTENPEQIAKQILAGCKQPEKITVMLTRQQAVLSALKKANKNDVILFAGKGHENYIVVGEHHIPYNERELVRSTYAHGAIS